MTPYLHCLRCAVARYGRQDVTVDEVITEAQYIPLLSALNQTELAAAIRDAHTGRVL